MNKFKKVLPIIFSFGVIFLFYIKRLVFLKIYPPLCNFFVFMVFFTSLFAKETIIQKIARAYGDKLDKPAWIYTRRVTYAWCLLTFFNFIVSIWTIFLPDKIWIIFNGCISYILIGLLFVVEYLIRIVLRKRNKI
jgi:uncharacterized membrane protein